MKLKCFNKSSFNSMNSNPTPNGKDDSTLAVKWDSLDPNNGKQMPYLDITAHLEQRFNPEAERTEFWDDIYEQYNGDVI